MLSLHLKSAVQVLRELEVPCPWYAVSTYSSQAGLNR